jgi:hypothetical protein
MSDSAPRFQPCGFSQEIPPADCLPVDAGSALGAGGAGGEAGCGALPGSADDEAAAGEVDAGGADFSQPAISAAEQQNVARVGVNFFMLCSFIKTLHAMIYIDNLFVFC